MQKKQQIGIGGGSNISILFISIYPSNKKENPINNKKNIAAMCFVILLTGLLQAQEISKFEYPGEDHISILDYVEVPVLIKYMLSTYGEYNPYTLIGPAFSFLIDSRFEVDNHEGDDYDGDLEDIKDVDTGIVFGLGFDIAQL